MCAVAVRLSPPPLQFLPPTLPSSTHQALAASASTSAPVRGWAATATATAPRHAAALDRVFVTGVPVFARHGVLPEVRGQKREERQERGKQWDLG